jgi:hypothetical protein
MIGQATHISNPPPNASETSSPASVIQRSEMANQSAMYGES